MSSKAIQIIFLIPIHFFSRYPPAIFVLPPNGIKSRDPHIVANYLHFFSREPHIVAPSPTPSVTPSPTVSPSTPATPPPSPSTPNTGEVATLEDKEPKNSEFKGNTQTWGLWWCWISECGYVNQMPQDWCVHCGHSKYAKNGNVHLNNLKRKLSKISGGSD